MEPLKTFIIYSHNDAEIKNELLKFISYIEKDGKIDIWSDGKIKSGTPWDATIKLHLSEAQLILPIISVDFFNSTYIQETEFKTAVERMNNKEARIIPILAKTCPWKRFPIIKDIQALPSNSETIDTWKSQPAAYTHIAEKLEEQVDEIIKEIEEIERTRLQNEADSANKKFLIEKAAREAAELDKLAAELAREEAKKAREETEKILLATEKAKFELENAKMEAEITKEEAVKAQKEAEFAYQQSLKAKERAQSELDSTLKQKEHVSKKYARAKRIAYSLGSTLAVIVLAGVLFFQNYLSMRESEQFHVSDSEMGARIETFKERIATLIHERKDMRRELLNVKKNAYSEALNMYNEAAERQMNERGEVSEREAMIKAKEHLIKLGLDPVDDSSTLRTRIAKMTISKNKEAVSM